MDVLIWSRRSEAEREDVGPSLHCPADPGDNVFAPAGAFIIQNFGGKNFGHGGDADDAVGVAAGGDDSGHMGAVALNVVGAGGAAGEVAGLQQGGF